MLWDSSVEGRSIWIPLGSLWKDLSWKKSRCRDQIHRFGSQTAARFLEHIAAKLLASQTRQTFDPHPTGSVYRTANTWLYIANVRKYVCLSHMHKLTTHSNVAMSSHMSTGTVLSSIVLLPYSFYILQHSPTIKHGHLKSCNLSSKGGGHCALRILRVGMLRHAQSICCAENFSFVVSCVEDDSLVSLILLRGRTYDILKYGRYHCQQANISKSTAFWGCHRLWHIELTHCCNDLHDLHIEIMQQNSDVNL